MVDRLTPDIQRDRQTETETDREGERREWGALGNERWEGERGGALRQRRGTAFCYGLGEL